MASVSASFIRPIFFNTAGTEDMSDFAGAPSGRNGEKDSGVSEGEISVDREPVAQCGHRFGLIGDVGLELKGMEREV